MIRYSDASKGKSQRAKEREKGGKRKKTLRVDRMVGTKEEDHCPPVIQPVIQPSSQSVVMEVECRCVRASTTCWSEWRDL